MRSRAPTTRALYPERLTRDGAVLLTYNHISLLQGLLDRPGGRAVSKRDLIAAAVPYVRRYRDPCRPALDRAVYTLHPSWLDWERQGTRLVYTLLPRGRAILDGQVRARVRGVGPYLPGCLWPGSLP